MNFGGGGYQSMDYKGDTYSGGGGYMVNQGGGGVGGYGGSPSLSQSQDIEGRKKVPKNQSIRPLTSALIQTAVHPTGDEPFRIDGEDIGQIKLVGEIVEISETATNCVYKIDDRTGPIIEVRRWIDDEDSPLELQKRAACRERVYVQIIGHMRLFNKQLSVIGFNVKLVQDFDEITHHLTETIYAHLAITKGLSLPKGFSEAHQLGEGVVTGGGWNPSSTSTQLGSYGYGMGQMDGGMDPAQRQVLSIITNYRSDQGIHLREVVSTARNHGFSDQNIRNAIDFLSNEGHVYTTIDDEHYKSTSEF